MAFSTVAASLLAIVFVLTKDVSCGENMTFPTIDFNGLMMKSLISTSMPPEATDMLIRSQTIAKDLSSMVKSLNDSMRQQLPALISKCVSETGMTNRAMVDSVKMMLNMTRMLPSDTQIERNLTDNMTSMGIPFSQVYYIVEEIKKYGIMQLLPLCGQKMSEALFGSNGMPNMPPPVMPPPMPNMPGMDLPTYDFNRLKQQTGLITPNTMPNEILDFIQRIPKIPTQFADLLKNMDPTLLPQLPGMLEKIAQESGIDVGSVNTLLASIQRTGMLPSSNELVSKIVDAMKNSGIDIRNTIYISDALMQTSLAAFLPMMFSKMMAGPGTNNTMPPMPPMPNMPPGVEALPFDFNTLKNEAMKTSTTGVTDVVNLFLEKVRNGPASFAKMLAMDPARRANAIQELQNMAAQESMDPTSVRSVIDTLSKTGRMPSQMDQDRATAEALFNAGFTSREVVDITNLMIANPGMSYMLVLLTRKMAGSAPPPPPPPPPMPKPNLPPGVEALPFDFNTLRNEASMVSSTNVPPNVNQFLDQVRNGPTYFAKMVKNMNATRRSNITNELADIAKKMNMDPNTVKSTIDNLARTGRMPSPIDQDREVANALIREGFTSREVVDITNTMLANPGMSAMLALFTPKLANAPTCVMPTCMTMMMCATGFKRDANGCPTCECEPSQNNNTNPCATIMCGPNEVCRLETVQCISGPCNPQPRCVSTQPTQCGEVMCLLFCENGFQKDSRGCPMCTCAPKNNTNSCATMQCPTGQKCELTYPPCAMGSTNCGPIPVCKAPTCVMPTCLMTMMCATGFKRDANGCPTCECEPIQNNNTNPCTTIKCGPNEVCKLETVQCFAAPCYPQPRCVSTQPTQCGDVMCELFCENGFQKDSRGCPMCTCAPKTNTNTCAAMQCPSGQMCELVYPPCAAGSMSCEPIAVCKAPPCPQVMCNVMCPNGYQKDSRGCQTCMCATDPTTPSCMNMQCPPGQWCEMLPTPCAPGSVSCPNMPVCRGNNTMSNPNMPPGFEVPTFTYNELMTKARQAYPGYVPKEVSDLVTMTRQVPDKVAQIMKNMTAVQQEQLPQKLREMATQLGANPGNTMTDHAVLRTAAGGQMQEPVDIARDVFAAMQRNGLPPKTMIDVTNLLMENPVIASTLPMYLSKMMEMVKSGMMPPTTNGGCQPADCMFGSYGDWMPCNSGLQMRIRNILQPPSCGGRCDGHTLETRSC